MKEEMFDIDEHNWYKCKECGAMCTEDMMRYIWQERREKRDEMLGALPPDERKKMAHQLPYISCCPNPKCDGCGERKGLHQILFIGDIDRKRIRRYVKMKSLLWRFLPWLKNGQPVC